MKQIYVILFISLFLLGCKASITGYAVDDDSKAPALSDISYSVLPSFTVQEPSAISGDICGKEYVRLRHRQAQGDLAFCQRQAGA